MARMVRAICSNWLKTTSCVWKQVRESHRDPELRMGENGIGLKLGITVLACRLFKDLVEKQNNLCLLTDNFKMHRYGSKYQQNLLKMKIPML